MIYTRRPERRYFLGIDIQDSFLQISYLNTRKFPAESEPHTFSFVAGEEAFNLPAAAYFAGEWLYGNDAVRAAAAAGEEPLTHILKSSEAGESVSCGGESASASSLLAGLLKYCFALMSVEVPAEETEAVCFTAEQMDGQTSQVIAGAAARAGAPEEKVYCEDHLRSFYSYMLLQDEEQKRHSVLLADGWKKDEISLISLSYNRKMKPVVCFPRIRHISTPGQMTAQDKDAAMAQALRKALDEEEASAAYLTGEAFDGSWMKTSLDLLCRGRRAFQGDNLYSKGAVCSLLASAGMADKAERYFYLEKDALRSNIGVRCEQRQRETYRALLDAGTKWSDAKAELDFMLEGDSEIVLLESPVDGNEPREISVVLENLPVRPQGTGRLRMRLSMSAADRLHISVEDLGFGEIFPSSGMRWEQEISV